MHPHFLGKQVALACVAARTCGEDVRPGVRSAAGQRHQVVARETLALPQLQLRAAAELAAVVVASKKKRVGDLAAEAAWDVDEADQPDYSGAWYRHSLGMDRRALSLDDFGLSVDDQPQCAADRHHGQGLKRGVES